MRIIDHIITKNHASSACAKLHADNLTFRSNAQHIIPVTAHAYYDAGFPVGKMDQQNHFNRLDNEVAAAALKAIGEPELERLIRFSSVRPFHFPTQDGNDITIHNNSLTQGSSQSSIASGVVMDNTTHRARGVGHVHVFSLADDTNFFGSVGELAESATLYSQDVLANQLKLNPKKGGIAMRFPSQQDRAILEPLFGEIKSSVVCVGVCVGTDEDRSAHLTKWFTDAKAQLDHIVSMAEVGEVRDNCHIQSMYRLISNNFTQQAGWIAANYPKHIVDPFLGAHHDLLVSVTTKLLLIDPTILPTPTARNANNNSR